MEHQLQLDADGKQHTETTPAIYVIPDPTKDSSSWHDTESVQQPSHVQVHGVFMLLGANVVDDNLPILMVSENSRDLFDKTPNELFALQIF